MKLLGLLLCGFGAALFLHLATVVIAPPGPDPFTAVLRPVAAWLPAMILGFLAAAVLSESRQLTSSPGRGLAILIVLVALAWPGYALAQDAAATTLNAGDVFRDFRDTIVWVVGLVVTGIVGLLAAALQKSTGVTIDAKMQERLQSVAMTGVQFGMDRIEHTADSINFDVKSKIVADAIYYIRSNAAKEVKHFKMNEVDLDAIARAKLQEVLPLRRLVPVSQISPGA